MRLKILPIHYLRKEFMSLGTWRRGVNEHYACDLFLIFDDDHKTWWTMFSKFLLLLETAMWHLFWPWDWEELQSNFPVCVYKIRLGDSNMVIFICSMNSFCLPLKGLISLYKVLGWFKNPWFPLLFREPARSWTYTRTGFFLLSCSRHFPNFPYIWYNYVTSVTKCDNSYDQLWQMCP